MDQGMETLTGSEFGATTSMGYRVVATLSTEFENEFQITLQNVPREVCIDLLKNYTIPLESYVGNSLYNRGTDNNEICEDSGADIIFVYQGNLNKPQENGCVEITACTNYDTRCQCVQCETGYILQNNLCKNDECPTGTKKSCGDGYSATFSSTTDAGSNCYTCTYIRPSGDGGYGNQD